MSELEIEKSKNAQLLTQCVMLRGEIVALKEKLAAARRAVRFHEYGDDRTEADLERLRIENKI